MTAQPSIFDEIAEDEATEAAADARAEADMAAGRVVSHEAVSRWLLTWGKTGRPPRPKCGE
ncbi:MAG: CopG family transcriptional regulator [Caulobacteraceae bacterium]|nr:CopG family transcriptional regulator [Caulobacteraceae bacterium]